MAKKPRLPETKIPYPPAFEQFMRDNGFDPAEASKPMGKKQKER